MMWHRPACRGALLLVTILGSGIAPSVALGQQAPTGGAVAAGSAADDKEARSLFNQGQVHYSLGEYEQAIADFRRAYELTSAPGLLFNIAQAHRLNGQCKQALEIYRHFVRLAPQSESRAEAQTQIAALAVRCGAVASSQPVESQKKAPLETTAAAPGPTVVIHQESAAPEPAPPRWSKRRRAAVALLATGVGAGLVAGGTAWWNQGRYDQWTDEDRRLAAAMTGTDPSEWIADQQRNDALLRSIQRADNVSLVLAGVSVAAIVTSAVLVVFFDR